VAGGILRATRATMTNSNFQITTEVHYVCMYIYLCEIIIANIPVFFS